MALKIDINIDVDGASVEDLYLARGILNLIDKGFQDDGMTSPDWLIDKLTSINSEITSRNRADLIKQLKTAEARRASLATIDEKRKALDENIERLKSKLG